ncbi:1,4-alpha-glucan branching protein GlgB [Clostridium saccharoperbutylacetonicum]|uniref:1,4-alpha-glucan branching protein GlgB n=1 Tax=Clostridium saccharoperbutylacetonicum TaxID=36745 RepID=UPI000983A762|nr:1,4-alpha-glucan branching protein GlgB [Clostridium saccharoperbutylacetonicum]AQR97985.1 1,4-alpha-glucan branching enzyme GlgB [Clostridium saccharoperbutylacetonicum]NSB33878.1 1,4-alpha-glucan branching enzyme [Clostridium saccharoperbutylacetonicum]
MRKDSKNSKSENEVIVSSIIDKSEEKVIKGLTKKDIADGQNAIKTKQSSQKKVLSTEETKIEPGIKEKEISVLEDDKDLKEKTKVTAKKTTAKRSTAVKSSSRSQKTQDSALKTQGDRTNKLSATDENTEEKIVASKTKKTATSTKSTTTRKAVAKKTIAAKAEEKQISKEVKSQMKKQPARNTNKKVDDKLDKSELTSFNTYLFHQGNNYEAYNIFGAHAKTENGKKGVQFATWAPNAKGVYVVGDFNEFEVSEEFKLEKITENGIWKGFFTEPKVGDRYKYCVIEESGERGEYKADPYAIQTELRPNNASIIYTPREFKWTDEKWIVKRNKISVLEQPINIYEIHLGSWKTNSEGGFLTYEQIAKELPKYLKEMSYTHVEIMPLVEHPLDASWGYQGTGYYSPTSRYGNLEGLKKLINKLHEENIGVIMDWVPGHFCKDSHGLYKFDGTPTYEYQDEWRAENKGWGTCNFDLGRTEVKSYLISNALYWFREFHIDGLRVDAVSSILYLDYSRSHGEWVPNKYGGNGNLEAIDFLKQLNKAVFTEYPTALMIAEESTAWPNVTKPTIYDGLGFNFKWNMGWMNDTLEYVQIDPEYRKHNHKNITFAMMYNYAENYLLPLSHDEVVHGKKSLIDKMWGDEWNRFAGLRAFIGYMMGHPGKKLLFMGSEFAQEVEWREYSQLDWNLLDDLEMHKKTQLFFKDLNKLYLNNKAFWELDHDYKGFNWIEADNNEQSILIFARRSRSDEDTLLFVINFTSTVYYDYRIGVPFLGSYEEIFNTDDTKYGGSGQIMDETLIAEKVQFHKQPYSLQIKVPPMAALVLKVKEIKMEIGTDEEVIEEI